MGKVCRLVVLVALALVLTACAKTTATSTISTEPEGLRTATPTGGISATPTQLAYPEPDEPTLVPTAEPPTPETYPGPAITPESATPTSAVPSPTPAAVFPAATDTATPISNPTDVPYPGPETSVPSASPTSASGPYPYPGPIQPTTAPRRSATPTSPGAVATATPGMTATLPPTLPDFTPGPTELPPRPVTGTPQPPAVTIRIWLSWTGFQIQALDAIIQYYQNQFPDVRFDVLYIPAEALLSNFEKEAYQGGGPSILIGPAEWGPYLYDRNLLADLSPYASDEFLATINAAALDSGIYQGAIISLPYAQEGVVLYRNRTLISSPAETSAELIDSARAVTGDGKAGAFLDRGTYFSTAHLTGLGGQLMDAAGNPAFNDVEGLAWINLLQSFEQAGAVEFNGNRDVQLFKQGKIGYIIAGSWVRDELAQAIGSENLRIDPWPVEGNGHLSGFVQAENVFLNYNLAAHPAPGELEAALQFIGYLMNPEIQVILAEAGFIPSSLQSQPRSPIIQQAMAAFRDGTAYPIRAESSVYWAAIETALLDIFERDVDPSVALQQAQEAVLAGLAELRNPP